MTSKLQKKLNQIIIDIKDKDTSELRARFKYQPKEQVSQIDWTAYSRAQLEELDNQLMLIRNMTDEAATRIHSIIDAEGREGRPPKDAADKAKAILIQQYFMATDMFCSSLVWFLREKLEIKERLTPKDIERAYDDPDVTTILMEVFRMTSEPIADKETKFSIDGTGMPTSIKQNYETEKGDVAKKAVYDMLIGMVGVNTKLFTAFEIAGAGSESPYMIPLLERTLDIYDRIDQVVGDAAYLSRENCSFIEGIGAVPYIFPKEGITLKQRKSAAWRNMLLALIDDPQTWLREYHKRSISESIFSVWKRKFLRPLARENESRRKVEAFARVVSYNIRRLPYLHYLQGLEVAWLGN